MALIFAVFLTNPSPICVLDEVDAPLDDANVDRFCRLMEEMSQRDRYALPDHHPSPADHVAHEPAVRRHHAGARRQPARVGGFGHRRTAARRGLALATRPSHAGFSRRFPRRLACSFAARFPAFFQKPVRRVKTCAGGDATFLTLGNPQLKCAPSLRTIRFSRALPELSNANGRSRKPVRSRKRRPRHRDYSAAARRSRRKAGDRPESQRPVARRIRGPEAGRMGQALKLATELVAGVAVGGFIGWALDRCSAPHRS